MSVLPEHVQLRVGPVLLACTGSFILDSTRQNHSCNCTEHIVSIFVHSLYFIYPPNLLFYLISKPWNFRLYDHNWNLWVFFYKEEETTGVLSEAAELSLACWYSGSWLDGCSFPGPLVESMSPLWGCSWHGLLFAFSLSMCLLGEGAHC